MADKGIATQDDMQGIKLFGERAAEHETPRKAPKIKAKMEKCDPVIRKARFTQKLSLQLSVNDFAKEVNSHFSHVENQFLNIEESMKSLSDQFDDTMDGFVASLCALEMEKAKLKIEVGSWQSVKLGTEE